MHTNIFPVLVVLSFGVLPPLFGQAASVLPLEQAKHGKSPFREGDQLDIQSDAVLAGLTRVTVLNIAHWPWVFAKSAQGETWLNFDHVVIAKIVVAAK